MDRLPDNLDSVQKIEFLLRERILTQAVLQYPEGGSETKINDPMLETILSMLVSSSKLFRSSSKQPRMSILAASMKSEHIVTSATYPEIIILGSEAKGTDASEYECLIQCFQVCADAAYALYLNGIPVDNCCVPGLLVFGENVVILGVYAIKEYFPVMVYLSPHLNTIGLHDRVTLAKWIYCLQTFLHETESLLKTKDIDTYNSSTRAIGYRLSTSLFFKPVRGYYMTSSVEYRSNCRTALNMIMVCYSKLFEISGSSQLFLLPVGVLTYQSDDNPQFADGKKLIDKTLNRYGLFGKVNQPLIVYDLLDGEWSNGKPESSWVESYLSCISKAVDMLNTACLVHIDMRPKNIMWRKTSSVTVEIKVIDFEDVVPVGSYLHNTKAYASDHRYPVASDSVDMRATISLNEWYRETISSWLKRSSYASYDDYMLNEDIKKKRKFE